MFFRRPLFGLRNPTLSLFAKRDSSLRSEWHGSLVTACSGFCRLWSPVTEPFMPQKIRIIGVPMDLGASRRGVDMGPSALRVAGLQARIKQLGHQVEDIGNISVKQPEEISYGEKRAKYLEEIAETCKDLAGTAEKSLSEGFLPLVLGGDHSIAIGVAAGVSDHF